MYRFLPCLLLPLYTVVVACASPSTSPSSNSEPMNSAETPSDSSAAAAFFALSFTDIDGKTHTMGEFKGRHLLLVNTASACGYTPQYKQLQELHQEFGSRLIVLGFPCNDFGGQESGSEQEIQTFCQKNYGVTFLMASKINIQGKDIHPVYQWLTQKSRNGISDAEVRWNFSKFMVDPNGRWLKAFPSSVSPLDPEITGLLQP